jgi:lipoate-protein ligase A
VSAGKTAIWRLIRDQEYSGAQNMARDEALLLCHRENSAPVLRFYNWNAPCVSIGRLQKNFDFSRAHNAGYQVVRRPTGGRAVLHQNEITYCAVVHASHLPRESRSVIGAYNWLSAGFIAGLQTLGIRAQLGSAHAGHTPGSTPGAPAANCFGAAAQCDFLVGDKKLIGAAQCRQNDVVLQHGAILLDIDEAAWHNAIGGEMEGAISLRALGVLPAREEIIRALAAGLESAWNIRFQSSVITTKESQLASRLHREKYSTADWTRYALKADTARQNSAGSE